METKMKIVTRERDVAWELEGLTYQEPFEEKVECGIGYRYARKAAGCGHKAILLMVIKEEEHGLCNERPPKVKIYPHDVTAIAIYLCTHCGEMTALWNQA